MKLIRYTPFPFAIEMQPLKPGGRSNDRSLDYNQSGRKQPKRQPPDRKPTLMMRIFRGVFGFYYLVIAYCAVAIFMVYVFGHRSFLEAIMPYAISGFQKMTELLICVSITTAIHESSR
ncbi:MAG: hypothetical protein VKJ24_14945 [Synechococcales bacterium]|nr:hypothetical protein [Synechococcales bacterium]